MLRRQRVQVGTTNRPPSMRRPRTSAGAAAGRPLERVGLGDTAVSLLAKAAATGAAASSRAGRRRPRTSSSPSRRRRRGKRRDSPADGRRTGTPPPSAGLPRDGAHATRSERAAAPDSNATEAFFKLDERKQRNLRAAQELSWVTRTLDAVRDIAYSRYPTLRKMFRSMDGDHDGRLSFDEFLAGVRRHMPIDRERAQVVFRSFRAGEDGLSYPSFVRLLDPYSADKAELKTEELASEELSAWQQERKAALRRFRHVKFSVAEKMQRKQRTSKMHPQDRKVLLKAFHEFDVTHRGAISYAEFREALNGVDHLNLGLADEEIMDLIRVMDKKDDGLISYKRFVEEMSREEYSPTDYNPFQKGRARVLTTLATIVAGDAIPDALDGGAGVPLPLPDAPPSRSSLRTPFASADRGDAPLYSSPGLPDERGEVAMRMPTPLRLPCHSPASITSSAHATGSAATGSASGHRQRQRQRRRQRKKGRRVVLRDTAAPADLDGSFAPRASAAAMLATSATYEAARTADGAVAAAAGTDVACRGGRADPFGTASPPELADIFDKTLSVDVPGRFSASPLPPDTKDRLGLSTGLRGSALFCPPDMTFTTTTKLSYSPTAAASPSGSLSPMAIAASPIASTTRRLRHARSNKTLARQLEAKRARDGAKRREQQRLRMRAKSALQLKYYEAMRDAEVKLQNSDSVKAGLNKHGSWDTSRASPLWRPVPKVERMADSDLHSARGSSAASSALV